MIDRKKFFDKVKASLFQGSLTQLQVDGMDAHLDEYEARGWTDLRWLAAVLGTSFTEVGSGMKPISENLNYSAQGLANIFPSRCAVDSKAKVKVPNAKAKEIQRKPVTIANYVYSNKNGNGDEASGDGWRYAGKGFAQTTGKSNYAKIASAAVAHGHKWDLVGRPEILLQPDAAVFALFEGSEKGIYTGKRLADYFNAKESDWVGSRAIINGSFKSQEYANNAKVFYAALT